MKLSEIKNWGPDIEKQISDKWKKAENFKFNKTTKKKIYSIDTPPPYVNTPIHIGQAVTYCYMDFFARYKRMKGFEVIFPLGLDNNGLPIEMGVEKKFNVSAFQVGREKFIELCRQLLEQAGTETKDTFAKLGISFTSYEKGKHIGAVYETDSPEYRSLTQSTFIELFKKGLIYEDTRINNWDPKLQTTIADSEIEYKDLPSTFNNIKWKVKETGEELIIATTRPELICTCGMVIFNPDDKRYKHLLGKHAISPIFGKEILIKAHHSADPEKGSGIVMMCSAGDLTDIQFFREQKLTPTIAIGKDGRMNKYAGKYEGLKVKEAREKIISDLKEKNLLVKQESIIHRTPISERSGAEIEFIEMPEFYLNQLDFKEDMKKIVKKVNFFPEEARKILMDWIESVSIDWPISRRRFYATPIPLWHSEDDSGLVSLGKPGKYYTPWSQQPEKDFEVYKKGKKVGVVKDFKCNWVGEERVLDTWMDSSISELNLLKYKEDDEFFKKAYPCSLRPQGKEIIRTWLYYTLLRGFLETGKSCFEDIWINQHIVDAKGFKMSKSKGNGIDPQILLKMYGADAIRLWASTEGDLAKQDLKCSEDRIRGELKTLNKLLNVSKFVTFFDKPKKKPKLSALDQLMVDYLENLTLESDESYSNYDFYHPVLKLRILIWEIFSSHYVELVKARAYNQERFFSEEESNSAKWTLHFILERILTLIYPVIPQLSTTIADELKINLLKSEFPKASEVKFDLSLVQKIMEFNSDIWKRKKDAGISLRESLTGVSVPNELKIFESDLISCHKI